MPYLFISITVAAIVTGELLLRKGMLVVGQFPSSFSEIWPFFLKVFSNPFVLGAMAATICAGLAWVAAVSRADALSRIYPFMAMSYVLVALLSAVIFKEEVTLIRWGGIIFVGVGLFLLAKT